MKKTRKLGFHAKKSQVTMFIIFGIILLLALLYIIFFNQEALSSIKEVNPEAIPVQNYVESCIEQLGREAINLIGYNGGYIYFPPNVNNNPLSYLSEGPSAKFKNPYWWYQGITSIPTEDYIEDQISIFIDENLQKCINEFSVFENSYNIVEMDTKDKLSTKVEIGNKKEAFVTIETRYRIRVMDKFNKTLADIPFFREEIPIRLYNAYTTAKKIMEQENKDSFLEYRTVDLVAMNPDIPDTGIEVTCSQPRWYLPDIKNNLKTLLQVNLPFIKIKGTNFDENKLISTVPLPDFGQASLEPTYNNSYYGTHYIWDVDAPDKDLSVSFAYDEKWPLELYARPSDGLFLTSNAQKGQDMLSFLCLHIWHFTYDVIYPVKVTIYDEKTTHHDPYTFMFSFMVSIDHMYPRRESFAVEDFETQNDIMTSERFCNDQYGNYTIYAVEDTPGHDKISNVNMTFTCGKYTCDIGQTENDYEQGGIPLLNVKLPYCVLGILKAKNKDHADAKAFIRADQEKGTIAVDMTPLKRFKKYEVVKHKFSDNKVSSSQTLSEGEQAAISLRYQDKDFTSSAIYPPFDTLSFELPDEGQLTLLDNDEFTYKLEIFLLDDEEIKGGYVANWTVDKNELKRATKIRFHVLSIDSKDDTELGLFLTGLSSYSLQAPKPELITE